MSDAIDRTSAEIHALLPLEEPDVDRFLELTLQLADSGTKEAAVVPFQVLDDRCPLGGVMQTVSARLQELSPPPVIFAMLETPRDTAYNAPHELESVLRAVVLADDSRDYLKDQWSTFGAEERSILRRHLSATARADAYRAECASLFDSIRNVGSDSE